MNESDLAGSGRGPAARAAELHRAACVCDMTLPWVPEAEGKDEALARFRAAGVDFVSLSVGVERIGLGQTLRYLL